MFNIAYPKDDPIWEMIEIIKNKKLSRPNTRLVIRGLVEEKIKNIT